MHVMVIRLIGLQFPRNSVILTVDALRNLYFLARKTIFRCSPLLLHARLSYVDYFDHGTSVQTVIKRLLMKVLY